MATAKEQLVARVAAMTEDEARQTLDTLCALDAPLSAEEDALLRARLDAADRGGLVPHDEVMARLRARFTAEHKRASGE
jgi:predicted transcriptional regulator